MTHLPETDSNDKTCYVIWVQNHKVPNQYPSCMNKVEGAASCPSSIFSQRGGQTEPIEDLQRIKDRYWKSWGMMSVGRKSLTQSWSIRTQTRNWDTSTRFTTSWAVAYFEKGDCTRTLQWAERTEKAANRPPKAPKLVLPIAKRKIQRYHRFHKSLTELNPG